MSWIVAQVHGSHATWGPRPDGGGLLVRGSLVCEIDPARSGPATLLHFARPGTREVLTLNHLEDGQVLLVHRCGHRCVSLSVTGVPEGPLRLTYSWDAPAGQSLLTAECPATGEIRQREGGAPPALSATLLVPPARLPPALRWWCVVPARHLVGIACGVAPETEIDTAFGPVPIGRIRAGQSVITASGRARPVLWSGTLSAPALGSFRPVCLVAPYFGASRDLIVHPFQRIRLSGAEVEYICGQSEVLVEAFRLVNGDTAVRAPEAPLFRWHGLMIDDPDLVFAGGCALETLNPGRLALSPRIAATTPLASLAATGGLPLLGRSACPAAAPFEAAALSLAMLQKNAPYAA